MVEGRLTLETRVGELLPALDERPVGGVTLGALVTHTSGLPRLPPGMWRKTFGAARRNPYADIDEPALYAAVSGITPRTRSRPVYSNLGFGLLGTALARHLRTSYDEAVRERIATPLGMGRTRSHPDSHLPGHTRRGRLCRQVWTFDALAGAGALWSSVDDLALSVRAHLEPPDGALGEAIRLIQRPLVKSGRLEQAMAWMKLSGRDGGLLFHNGGTAGYRSFVGVDTAGAAGWWCWATVTGASIVKGSGWLATTDPWWRGDRCCRMPDVRHGARCSRSTHNDGATMAFLGFNVDPTSAYGERLADTPEVVVDVALADAGSRTARRWTPESSAALSRAAPRRWSTASMG